MFEEYCADREQQIKLREMIDNAGRPNPKPDPDDEVKEYGDLGDVPPSG